MEIGKKTPLSQGFVGFIDTVSGVIKYLDNLKFFDFLKLFLVCFAYLTFFLLL